MFLLVRVQPGASKDMTDGVVTGLLKVRLRARAIDGAANNALIEFLSKLLGIRKSALSIESGLKARKKRVRVEGMGAMEVEKILSASIGPKILRLETK